MENKTLYWELRNLVWRILILCGIDKLPVDLKKIADRYNIKITSYQESGKLPRYASEVKYTNENITIYYNDELPKKVRRFKIAHELGHIFLKHYKFANKAEYEKEAKMFAARLLMPLIILKKVGAETSEEISKLCNVSITAATFRVERQKTVEPRNKYLSNKLEVKVLNNFEKFIEKQRKE